MNKIPSFTVDHLRLLPGVYVSRLDRLPGGDTVTTFDLRITRPNEEPVMETGEVHTLEHLGATYLRNDAEWADRVVYFGPMGCRTGFYLLLAGSVTPEEILPLLKRTFRFITEFEGDIPGAAPKDCGNYSDQNLPLAKFYAARYLAVLEDITPERMNYPG